jgi:hypothetical protein
MDEFKDNLGYNLENIGVPTNDDFYALLRDYLLDILFKGSPIIVSRLGAFTLIKCVSNALVGTPEFSVIEFASDVTERKIEDFLSQDSRIVCLDNFIGNFNETLLLTICDRHKDKIIFLTVTYDRTLFYVARELMKYCCYLNINRITAFAGNVRLTVEPSMLEEEEVVPVKIAPDTRWSTVLKEILDEFEICSASSVHKSSLITDEYSLCRSLAFDVLPYCIDVLKIAPYNASERLIRYAGDGGRCSYRSLFRRWFVV